jgi:hypothetical protein
MKDLPFHPYYTSMDPGLLRAVVTPGRLIADKTHSAVLYFIHNGRALQRAQNDLWILQTHTVWLRFEVEYVEARPSAKARASVVFPHCLGPGSAVPGNRPTAVASLPGYHGLSIMAKF